MVADPEVVEENVTEHEPAVNVQLVVVPKPPILAVQDTVPVGVMAVPASVSVTVAVQVVAALTMTEGGAQTIAVVVILLATVTVVLPELVAWVVSPA